MFRLYHSNDLQVLKSLLVHQLNQAERGEVFDADHILVQSQGMAHWLKINIADELGLAANLNFPLPSSFIWQVLNVLKPDLPASSHFEKEAMTWKLFRLLPQLKDDADFASIAHYLQDDDHQLKTFQLASNLADTFDQYLVYRPDWLLAWEAGQDNIVGVNAQHYQQQKWQAKLWRLLVADSEQLQQSLFHRARLLEQLPNLIKENHQALKQLPKQLYVFGIAALPVSYWQVLQAISPYVDIHFYLLNPCRNFWGDIISPRAQLKLLARNPEAGQYLAIGNPLLASWGRLGRDFVTLVHESISNEQQQNAPIYDVEAYVQYPPETLLQHVQQDILQLSDASSAAFNLESLQHSLQKTAIKKDDHSIQVVSCHSYLREVQVLHDQILHWMENDPELKAKDILVMLPDVDTYAPYIEAVFASAESKIRLPWALSDQSLSQENPIIESFLQLLNLSNSRVSASDVMALLEVQAIRQAFAIEEHDLQQIQTWIDSAFIRWGVDGASKQQFNLPENDLNTWAKGLRQLQLGFLLPDEGLGIGQGDNQDWPISAVENNQQAVLLGQLIALIDRLAYWQKSLQQDNSPEGWQKNIQRILQEFYHGDVAHSSQLQVIRQVANDWLEQLQQSAVDQPLSLHVVLQVLQSKLNKQTGWQRFLVGPINFCTLMPMRSIPFKVVCMLGMNDEDYPRSVPSLGFDLMARADYRRGDRSRREDDRYLFLEALVACQHTMYISYRGHESKENSELQPSVLVSELLDYLTAGYCLQQDQDLAHSRSEKRFRQHLLIEQRLQPFYSDYFSEAAEGNHLLASYHNTWAQVAITGQEASAKTQDSTFLNTEFNFAESWPWQSELLLQDLIYLWQNPARYFLQKRLNIQLDMYARGNDFIELQDDEPFLTDGLQNYLIKHDLFEKMTRQKSSQALEQKLQQTGQLPAGVFAEKAIVDNKTQVEDLHQLLSDKIAQPIDNLLLTLNVELAQQSLQLQADMAHLYQTGQVQARVGRVRGRDFINAWLHHLLLSAADSEFLRQQNTSCFVGLDKKAESGHQAYQFVAMLADDAKAELQRLLLLAQQSMNAPLPFMVDSAFNYIHALLKLQQRKNKELDSPLSQRQFLQQLDHEKIIDIDCLNAIIEGGFNQANQEVQDSYIQRCFGQQMQHGDDEFWPQTATLWLDIFLPAFNYLRFDQDDNLLLQLDAQQEVTHASA